MTLRLFQNYCVYLGEIRVQLMVDEDIAIRGLYQLFRSIEIMEQL